MKASLPGGLFLAGVLLCGCGALADRPLTISAWSPTEERIDDTENLTVSVTFSAEVDRVRTEEAFSLSSEGVHPPGSIEWEGTMMTFVPWHPLEAGREYRVKVGTGAEDLRGNSLSEEFLLVFFTGKQSGRPVVTDADPPDRAEITDIYQVITLTFDQGIDRESFLSEFTVSPAVEGVWSFHDDDSVCVLTPVQPYTRQKEYTLTLSENLRAKTGSTLAEKWESRFYLGTEQDRPRVLAVLSEDSSRTLEISPPDHPEIAVNTGWGKDTGLRFIFSEAVLPDSAEAAFMVEPPVEHSLQWDESPYPPEMNVHWDEPLEWEVLYRIEISASLKDLQENMMRDPEVCYLYVNGPSSRPPEIARVEFVPDETSAILLFDRDDPGNCLDSHIFLDTSSGLDITRNPFFFDYYLHLAEGAGLPFFQFVENFSIQGGNDCLSVTCLNFQIFNPGDSLDPAAVPKPTPGAEQAVVRLIVSLTDAWDTSGLLSFRVYGDLEDSLGNRMEEDWIWELFDEDN